MEVLRVIGTYRTQIVFHKGSLKKSTIEFKYILKGNYILAENNQNLIFILTNKIDDLTERFDNFDCGSVELPQNILSVEVHELNQ